MIENIANLAEFRIYLKKYTNIVARKKILEAELNTLRTTDDDEDIANSSMSSSPTDAIAFSKTNKIFSKTENSIHRKNAYIKEIQVIRKELYLLDRYLDKINIILDMLNDKEQYLIRKYMNGNTYVEIAILYSQDWPKDDKYYGCSEANVNNWLKKTLDKMFSVYNISETCDF